MSLSAILLLTKPWPRTVRWLAVLLMMTGLLLASSPYGPVQAQTSTQFGSDDTPVEIFSDNGIEWIRDSLLFIARGNARAIKGDTEITGDELRAYYRERPEGGTRIWRLEAYGNVKITTPGEYAQGDKGLYDLDQGVMVLTGTALQFATATEKVTARDSLEYWVDRRLAVGRGDALVIHDQERLRGEIISAQFKRADDGKTEIVTASAYGAVTAVTATETASAEKGSYDVKTGIVTLFDSVKITREGNQVNGCRAEVNLRTGISEMFSCPEQPESGQDGRVRGLLVPKS